MPHNGEVLIVDGDAAIRRLLEVVVRTIPRRPVIAADGRSALSLLENHTYDAVVLELVLPEVSGVAVLGRMEEQNPEQLRHTVVVTTEPETRWRACRQMPKVAAILRKPFALEDLQMALRKCCDGGA